MRRSTPPDYSRVAAIHEVHARDPRGAQRQTWLDEREPRRQQAVEAAVARWDAGAA